MLMVLLLSTSIFARPVDETSHREVTTSGATTIIQCHDWALGYLVSGRIFCEGYCMVCAVFGQCDQFYGAGCRNQLNRITMYSWTGASHCLYPRCASTRHNVSKQKQAKTFQTCGVAHFMSMTLIDNLQEGTCFVKDAFHTPSGRREHNHLLKFLSNP